MANNFKADLAYGQLGESFVSELGKDVSIEVKRDRLALSTGNIFLEVECNGKPSGIMSTQASYWVHLIPKGDLQVAGYILQVNSLKTAISVALNEGWAKEKNWSGDGGRVKGIVISLADIGALIEEMANAS